MATKRTKKPIQIQVAPAAWYKKLSQSKYAPIFAPSAVFVVLAAAVYFLAIVPSQPDALLKKALINSFEPGKNNSMRYSGSAGMRDENIKMEFSGQISGKNNSMVINSSYGDADSSLETVTNNGTNYVKLTGTQNLNNYVISLSGNTRSIDASLNAALVASEGKWVNVSDTETKVVADFAGCSNVTNSPGVSREEFDAFIAKKPLKITAGPFTDDGDSNIMRLTVGFDDPVHVMDEPVMSGIVGLMSCLSKAREGDYKTRNTNSQDYASLRADIYIDRSTLIINKIVMHQFDSYFQLLLKDYNKDVAIQTPTESVSLRDFLLGLPEDTRSALIGKLGF